MSDTRLTKPVIRALTHSENLVWTGQQLAGEQPLYSMVLGFLLSDIEPGPFCRAFERLVERCPPLHAAIRGGTSHPEMVYRQAEPVELPVYDFTAEPAALERARDWMSHRASRPFAANAPLVDSALLQIGERRYIWYLNQHHIMTDAWSCRLLLNAMDEDYHNILEGGSVLPVLPLPSPDRAAAEALDRAYWRDLYNSVAEQAR